MDERALRREDFLFRNLSRISYLIDIVEHDPRLDAKAKAERIHALNAESRKCHGLLRSEDGKRGDAEYYLKKSALADATEVHKKWISNRPIQACDQDGVDETESGESDKISGCSNDTALASPSPPSTPEPFARSPPCPGLIRVLDEG